MKSLKSLFAAALVAAFLLPASASADSCVSSYYWQGTKTASGQRFNPEGFTAAHRSLPFGTKLRVTHAGRSVIVTINDRGPFIKGRCLDLSRGAARAIGLTGKGIGVVHFEKV